MSMRLRVRSSTATLPIVRAAVGRRREDEDVNGDYNQEDEPTHKGAGAGHEDDDSSSCTTLCCSDYRQCRCCILNLEEFEENG
ncbi:hypothetical protein ZWY2020_024129 [Hordeum vulgare]|nr:hypothetical protein ZWY2020_014034 [Hordeum vulgare]KAI5011995.1 hypothetical protein ZWY2020_024129 [Hordeum vulgare]